MGRGNRDSIRPVTSPPARGCVIARVESVLARRTVPAWFFLVLVSVYLATAYYGGNVVNDVHSAAHAAWSLATRGTLDLSGLDLPYDQAWVVEVGDAEYSNRFPGVIAAAVPLYALVRPELPLVWPSAASAAVAAAVGVTAVLVGLRRLVPHRYALAGAAFLGLGTGVWAVGADGLWGHGITTMWLGLTFAGLATGGRGRALAAVAGMGAVLTRPHLAVGIAVAAAVLWRRDRAGAVALAAGAAVGAAAFLLYGRVLFGEWSLTGGYDTKFLDADYDGNGTVDGSADPFAWRAANVWTALVATRVGLLPAYAVALPALWALVKVRRSLPPTIVALAVGALANAVAQTGLNRIAGGSGFWGNRTLIETIVLAWPLAVAAVAAHTGGRVWRAVFALATAWTVGFHALGSIGPSPAAGDPDDPGNAWFWQVPWALAETEPWRLAVVGVMAVAAGGLAWVLTASRSDAGSDEGSAEPGDDPVAVEHRVRGRSARPVSPAAAARPSPATPASAGTQSPATTDS
jgi:alpha-1,2-mannosyltransferase